jgi:hypothetical protein
VTDHAAVRGSRPGAVDRPTVLLRVILLATFVSSIFHYTDNYVRFDQYPPAEDGFVSRPLIWQSWIVFTAVGAVGYLLYRRERWLPAAACLAFYAVSGLISPLHYTEGAWSEFDAFQHFFIVTDFVVGAAVLGFAAWLVVRATRSRSVPLPA